MRAGGDLVGGVREERLARVDLPGAVRAHERVDLARAATGESDAAQDLGSSTADVQVVDLEQGFRQAVPSWAPL